MPHHLSWRIPDYVSVFPTNLTQLPFVVIMEMQGHAQGPVATITTHQRSPPFLTNCKDLASVVIDLHSCAAETFTSRIGGKLILNAAEL